MQRPGSTTAALCSRLDSAFSAVTAAHRHLLDTLIDCERAEVWRADGARDLAEWLAARLGISKWAARRWINAARVLPSLPLVSDALEAGTLSLDKVVELCRFATPETEKRLISWARRVRPATIRERGDVLARRAVEEVVDADRGRSLNWWRFD